MLIEAFRLPDTTSSSRKHQDVQVEMIVPLPPRHKVSSLTHPCSNTSWWGEG